MQWYKHKYEIISNDSSGLPRKNGSIFLILIRWHASLYPHKLSYASRKSRAPILKAVVRRQWCLNDLRAIQPLVNLAFITHTWPQAGRSGIVVPGGWTRTITWEDGCTQTCFTFHVREQSTHDRYMTLISTRPNTPLYIHKIYHQSLRASSSFQCLNISFKLSLLMSQRLLHDLCIIKVLNMQQFW